MSSICAEVYNFVSIVLMGASVHMSRLHIIHTSSLSFLPPLLHGGKCVLMSSGLILCGSWVYLMTNL